MDFSELWDLPGYTWDSGGLLGLNVQVQHCQSGEGRAGLFLRDGGGLYTVVARREGRGQVNKCTYCAVSLLRAY